MPEFRPPQEWPQELLKNLEGSSKKANPKPIEKYGQKIIEGQKKANHFNNFLSRVNKSTRRKNLDKALWKPFKRKQKAPSCNALPLEQDFTIQELQNTIRKALQTVFLLSKSVVVGNYICRPPK